MNGAIHSANFLFFICWIALIENSLIITGLLIVKAITSL